MRAQGASATVSAATGMAATVAAPRRVIGRWSMRGPLFTGWTGLKVTAPMKA